MSTDRAPLFLPPGAFTFVAGGGAGVAQVAAEYPFDTVKTRVQSTALSYRGPVDCIVRTFQREGVRAFYQGVTPRLLTYGVVKSTLFSIYERAHGVCGSTALAGAMAGAVNTLVSCPVEIIKSKLQIYQRLPGKVYDGPLQRAQALIAAHVRAHNNSNVFSSRLTIVGRLLCVW
mmetsp:Transcript_33232/g.95904  ORF Transcript_33232/g.95904 Transcript_33232/m.95904 type:complete len:174 (-) Transcript_33232:987-1508(-)